MPTPLTPLAEAEALFLSGLQPALNLGALAAQGVLALVVVAGSVLAAGLAVYGASAWRSRRARSASPQSPPHS